MCENRQVLLDNDVCCHRCVVYFRAALVVVYTQDVGILRAVGVALQGASLWAPICSLHCDAATEIWSRWDFHLTSVRQTLCSAGWNWKQIIIIISLLMSPLGTVLTYGLHIRRTGYNPPRGPSAGWWVENKWFYCILLITWWTAQYSQQHDRYLPVSHAVRTLVNFLPQHLTICTVVLFIDIKGKAINTFAVP
jgi:hypothetical protein